MGLRLRDQLNTKRHRHGKTLLYVTSLPKFLWNRLCSCDEVNSELLCKHDKRYPWHDRSYDRFVNEFTSGFDALTQGMNKSISRTVSKLTSMGCKSIQVKFRYVIPNLGPAWRYCVILNIKRVLLQVRDSFTFLHASTGNKEYVTPSCRYIFEPCGIKMTSTMLHSYPHCSLRSCNITRFQMKKRIWLSSG